jgi:hypothetical protein
VEVILALGSGAVVWCVGFIFYVIFSLFLYLPLFFFPPTRRH